MKSTISNLIMTTVIICISQYCAAQNYSIEPQLISTSGGYSSNYDMHSSLGENFIAYLDQDNLQATCGFYQSSHLLTTVEEKLSNIEVKLFPNPTSRLLTIETHEVTDLKFCIINAHGKRIMSSNISEYTTNIDLSQYPVGQYYLQITNSQDESNIYKILKTN